MKRWQKIALIVGAILIVLLALWAMQRKAAAAAEFPGDGTTGSGFGKFPFKPAPLGAQVEQLETKGKTPIV
jgi:hypothetical protein